MAVYMSGADLRYFEFINFCRDIRIWTHITHVDNTMSFYVQPLKYKPYVSLVSQPGNKILTKDLTLLKIVVFKDVKMGRYLRGKIIDINGDHCDVFAIDFGFIRKAVPLQDLFERNVAFSDLPLAIHCQLDNCNFLEDQNAAARAFCIYTDNERALITVVGTLHGKYLVNVNYGQNAVQMMTMAEHFGLAFSRNEINVSACRASAEHYLKSKSYTTGTKLNVKFLAGETLDMFYVADLADSNSSLLINEIYQQDLVDLDYSQFRKGFPVSAFSKERRCFVRGLIQVVNNILKTAEVYLVDLGRTETIHFMDLKEVPNTLFTIPMIAIKCAVNAEQIFDYHCQKYLSNKQTFYITIMKPSADSFNVIKVSDD